jgi:hypothetical protein
MGTKRNIYIYVLVAAFIVTIAFVPLFLDENTMNLFVKEDMIYETLSPIYLGVTAVMFGIAFYRSRDRFRLKPYGLLKLCFLGFTAVFFLATMEEISWGQRIFNFGTPAAVDKVNVQHEFTFHNLKLFQGDQATLPLDFDQLAAAFALTLGVVIPVAVAIIRPVRAFLLPRFPVLPVQFSPVFVWNYILQKVAVRVLPLYPELYHNTTKKIPAVVHEIREHNYDLLLMAAAIFFIILQLDKPEHEQVAASTQESKVSTA